MRDVYVAGIGITSFTRLEYPLVEIAAYPGLMAMKESESRPLTSSMWPIWVHPASIIKPDWPVR